MKISVSRTLSANIPDYTEAINKVQDIYDTWIIENLGYRIIPVQQTLMEILRPACAIRLTYDFKCDEDATAFKLRWT